MKSLHGLDMSGVVEKPDWTADRDLCLSACLQEADMRVFRILFVLLNVAAAIGTFYVMRNNASSLGANGGAPFFAMIAIAAFFAANAYLLFIGIEPSNPTTRVGRMWSYWWKAKEAELESRAKGKDR